MKRRIVLCALGLLMAGSSAHAAGMDEAVADLQKQWAIIKYETPDKERQQKSIAALTDQASEVSQDNPGKAEPLIWQAIIVSTKAGIDGGMGALAGAKQARALLLEAEKINPEALDGSIYTSLGSLYYKVPGWPLAFGDNAQAKQYLLKALAINPDGIDANFFYGEFLYETGDYAKSKSTLEHGMKAPGRPGRELADKGRREEIQELLTKLSSKLS
ncbi:MAG TPA: tetratricopeptide repeat protein [Bradyrhizobium sp.]|nr:tetratricopeptide repeat protein [Bradyrhizobium sp.]